MAKDFRFQGGDLFNFFSEVTRAHVRRTQAKQDNPHGEGHFHSCRECGERSYCDSDETAYCPEHREEVEN